MTTQFFGADDLVHETNTDFQLSRHFFDGVKTHEHHFRMYFRIGASSAGRNRSGWDPKTAVVFLTRVQNRMHHLNERLAWRGQRARF